MLLRHLHRIGPSDTPISSPPLLLSRPGWPAWLESSGGVLHASSQALNCYVTNYLGTSPTAQELRRSDARWPVQAQLGPNLTPWTKSSNSPLRVDALLA